MESSEEDTDDPVLVVSEATSAAAASPGRGSDLAVELPLGASTGAFSASSPSSSPQASFLAADTTPRTPPNWEYDSEPPTPEPFEYVDVVLEDEPDPPEAFEYIVEPVCDLAEALALVLSRLDDESKNLRVALAQRGLGEDDFI